MQASLGLNTAQLTLRPDGRALIDGLAGLPEILSDELLFCFRNPFDKFARDKTQIPPCHAGRIGRTLAFGQHLSRSKSSDQFGIYGTSAAIEVMANCPQAQALLKEPPPDFINNDWLMCFLRTWNYFDLIAHEFSLNAPIDQARSTLRICHMLRAAAAARSVIRRLATAYRDRIDPDLKTDLRLDSDPDPAKRIGSLMFDKLSTVRVEEAEKVFTTNPSHKRIYTFLYGTDSEPQGTPKSIREWLFLWSSVLVAVHRAMKSGIIEESQVASVITVDDLSHIRLAIENDALKGDPRCAAIGLWALDQLRRSSTESGENSLLGFWIRENKSWLHKQVGLICHALLKSPMWQDIYVPYERNFTAPHTVQFLDFFVLPVFPVLIDLVAQHQPRNLFRPSVRRRLEDSVTGCQMRLPDESLCALPYQNSPWNGTVNCLYFREACQSLSQALKKRKNRIVWLANWIWGWSWGQPWNVVAVFLMVVALVASFYMLYISKTHHDKTIYFMIGLLTSLMANVLTTLFLPWLRRNLPSE